MKKLLAKQQKLFASKDFSKWENPEILKMTKADQEELLKDNRNVKLIGVDDQIELWRLR